jgi:hypothetical protein
MFTERFTKMPSKSHRDCAEASMWLLARKVRSLDSFVIPQQRFWAEYYGSDKDGAQAAMQIYRNTI